MSLRERLLAAWRWLQPKFQRWVEPWARPLVIVAGTLVAAGLVALLVVRLATQALALAPERVPPWEREPPAPSPSPDGYHAAGETPKGTAEYRHGVWVLWLAGGALVLLVLIAAVGETLVHDNRPADYFAPLAPRPVPGANLLQGYHWVDQNGGVVQIPIDRAMDLLIQRGLPARSPADSQGFVDHGQGGPSYSSGGRSP